jgi:flagellar biosynthetic protein FliR
MDLPSWLNLVTDRYAAALLIFVRFGAMLFAAPLIGGRHVPNQVRLGLSGLLALAPLAPRIPETAVPILVAALFKEALLGLVLGWVASLVFSGVQMAGDWLDLHGGFQAGHILNPAFDVQNAPLGNFMYLLAGMTFLGTGGHGILIRAAASTLTLSPPGTLALPVGTADAWIGLVVRTFWVAVQLAAPIAAALLLMEIAVGLMNRALPQVNVMMLTLPVKALLAICAVALCVPPIVRVMAAVFQDLGGDLTRVLRAVGA